MPAGVTWPEYIKFMSAAMVLALAGAQTVHLYYKPLQDLDKLVEEELQKRRQQRSQNISIK